MSQRKIDGYLKLIEIINWGRKYPIRFVERFFGIELLDFQKYVFMESWNKQFVVWCMGRSSGKTTLGAPFIMAKSMLIPKFESYILAGVGSQSQEMFMKIEKIAKKEIASFTGLTDIFFNETVKSAANKDGFTHDPASFKYSLYNGSVVRSLNGAVDNIRSKRSNLNFYDESGFAGEDLFLNSEPFCTQNSDFKLGGENDVTLFPRQFPNQLIYASSASSVDTYFYSKYRDFSMKMFLGDKRYFVADINSDVVINATYNGKLYPVPLLTQEAIDNAVRQNSEKAMREYKNIFTTEGGNDQIVKRATIIRNSKLYLPILANEGNKKFITVYDPARSYDNSICGVGEIYIDPHVGYKLRIANMISFIDIAKKTKKPMRTPEQIELIKQILLDYNGRTADYENILSLLIDAGAGGGGVQIADFFMEDWIDSNGNKHRGLIDKIESKDYVYSFPNAVDKLKLVSPKKYKNEMFEALIEMMNLDLIDFTESYDNKDIILFNDINTGEQKIHTLSFDEKMALVQIDLTKEELVNIYRFESHNGSCRYNLPPDKEKKMHDDRAFCVAMMAWYLQQLRRDNIINPNIEEVDEFEILKSFCFI